MEGGRGGRKEFREEREEFTDEIKLKMCYDVRKTSNDREGAERKVWL